MTTYGIIGCGRIAQRHAKHIKKLGTLEAVCDIVPERAQAFAKYFNCLEYHKLDKFLEVVRDKVDVVAICSPNGLHAEHTIRVLEAGAHVVCEKPMATTVADARRMIQTAEQYERNLFIVKQNRFNPPVAAVKEVIDAGRLGAIFDVHVSCFWNRDADYYKGSEWKGSKKLDGGTLFTQFSHFIDLMLWLVDEVDDVEVHTGNYMHQKLIDFEDTGVVLFRFKNGALGTLNYTVSSYKQNMQGAITLFGEKGTVKIGGQYLNVLEYQCIENHEIEDIPASRPANDYGYYKGSMSNHDKVYENVENVLKNNGEIATSGKAGLKTVELIEKIYRQV